MIVQGSSLYPGHPWARPGQGRYWHAYSIGQSIPTPARRRFDAGNAHRRRLESLHPAVVTNKCNWHARRLVNGIVGNTVIKWRYAGAGQFRIGTLTVQGQPSRFHSGGELHHRSLIVPMPAAPMLQARPRWVAPCEVTSPTQFLPLINSPYTIPDIGRVGRHPSSMRLATPTGVTGSLKLFRQKTCSST